jgi:hypothetical protein
MPDGRNSQVRFEALAFRPFAFPLPREVQALVRIRPDEPMVCSQLSSISCLRLMSALFPTTALTMEPPSAQSPFA